jgi:hypothetical protein
MPKIQLWTLSLLLAGCVVEVSGEDLLGEEEDLTRSTAVSKHKIDRFWKRFKDDDIRKSWASENGGRKWAGDYLAWRESMRQRALVDMYLATKDVAFLDELVKRARVVFSLRDDVRGKRDKVRGRVMKAWGRYPDVGISHRTGTWVCEMVQNGMITYPIADFVRIAHRSSALRARYGDTIARFRKKLTDTVDAFDDDWDDMGDEGFYRFPKGYGKVYPYFEGRVLHYNRPLALGRTMMLLEQAGISDHHRHKYRKRVRMMARFFLRDTWRGKSGSRVWYFSKFNPSVENVSHGGIIAGFIALAKKRDYTKVGRSDLEGFVETFLRITRHRDRIAATVDGKYGGYDQKDSNQACGRWLDLAAHRRDLVRRCSWVLDHGFDTQQVGFAKSLRYR